jgi:hypothetical protein
LSHAVRQGARKRVGPGRAASSNRQPPTFEFRGAANPAGRILAALSGGAGVGTKLNGCDAQNEVLRPRLIAIHTGPLRSCRFLQCRLK